METGAPVMETGVPLKFTDVPVMETGAPLKFAGAPVKFTRRWVFGAQRTKERYRAAVANRGIRLKETPRFTAITFSPGISSLRSRVAADTSKVATNKPETEPTRGAYRATAKIRPAAERSESHVKLGEGVRRFG